MASTGNTLSTVGSLRKRRRRHCTRFSARSLVQRWMTRFSFMFAWSIAMASHCTTGFTCRRNASDRYRLVQPQQMVTSAPPSPWGVSYSRAWPHSTRNVSCTATSSPPISCLNVPRGGFASWTLAWRAWRKSVQRQRKGMGAVGFRSVFRWRAPQAMLRRSSGATLVGVRHQWQWLRRRHTPLQTSFLRAWYSWNCSWRHSGSPQARLSGRRPWSALQRSRRSGGVHSSCPRCFWRYRPAYACCFST
mmetsp:Transcript_98416/g.199800  ORF Transcript_98416/g.199800 Transcript_98416/m.199800 type:complete len:247 (+) Transcript_98416:439-1179(+)